MFPSNYVEVIDANEAEQNIAPPAPSAAPVARSPSPEPAPASSAAAPAKSDGPTAIAIYDYEATEENEISFPEGATITDIQFPDDDWWAGVYNGHEGLFVSTTSLYWLVWQLMRYQPANYVELQK